MTDTTPDDRRDAISSRAYQLWESEGRPEGRDQRNWEQASVEIADARADAAQARKVSQKKTKSASTVKSRAAKPKSPKT